MSQHLSKQILDSIQQKSATLKPHVLKMVDTPALAVAYR
jgi:hypothetical protein